MRRRLPLLSNFDCLLLLSAAVQTQTYRGYHSDESTFGFVPKRKSTFDPFVNPITPQEAQRLHLINAYRRHGYLKANLDPLNLTKVSKVRELDPGLYGLNLNDTDGNGITVEKLVKQLEALYCGPIAVEFMHLNVSFVCLV